MSTDAIDVVAPETEVAVPIPEPVAEGETKIPAPSSPPPTDSAPNVDASDSELSDIEEPEEDIGEVEPTFIEDGVPVFHPQMAQFKHFELYVKKLNEWGMKHGIVKVIPPQEWLDNQPPLHEAVKTIKIREPIKQEIIGGGGKYRQLNVLHQRSYNLPQWRQLCDQSEHQPPAKRGERRANHEKPSRPTPRPRSTATTTTGGSKKKGPGRPFKSKAASLATGKEERKEQDTDAEAIAEGSKAGESAPDRLPTPVSPAVKAEEDLESVRDEADDYEGTPVKGRMGGTRQPKAVQSVSSRRKHSRREAAGKIDEAAFKDFNHELEGDDFSKERCEYLEEKYWKTLTYASPYYGADMLGTLFDDRTTDWNLGKLSNLLDVLGTKVPGVNTAYLYLGMWKATFAWHLEDVDLYSINYLHFGAPKQWYSISQKDARNFERAMKSIWPDDAKNCDQFLRHKTFLISPSTLLNSYNVKVNKMVHRPGEFIITFPYGYHSGYNLGYNCAEAVNFGLESWLQYGRIAKKCDCSQAQDSVWIDVNEIERKLRGDETEFEETEDEDDMDEEVRPTDLPTPPESSGDTKHRRLHRKRKRSESNKGNGQTSKKIHLRLSFKPPCALCPNNHRSEPLLSAEDGRKVHQICAQYIPETEIETSTPNTPEIVTGIGTIQKARMDLRCNYCKSKLGACFQCSQKKCTRAYHATCAAPAGVFVEKGEVPSFGPDGTEYKEDGIEFSCRFHRTKRDKNLEGAELGEDLHLRTGCAEAIVGKTVQWQPFRGEIFAGTVVENWVEEEILLVDIQPKGKGGRFEISYRWLIFPDPSDYHLPKPSANAIPMPKTVKVTTSLRHQDDDVPRPDDIFVPGFMWKTFESYKPEKNAAQMKIDFSKENQIWHYLGKTSTEARAQYTEDIAKPVHNPKGNFLDTIPKPLPAVVKIHSRHSFPASFPYSVNQNALNAARSNPRPILPPSTSRSEKPYEYKPRDGFGIASTENRPATQLYRPGEGPLTGTNSRYSFGSDPKYASRKADDQGRLVDDRGTLLYPIQARQTSSYSPLATSKMPQHTVSQSRPLTNVKNPVKPVNPFSNPTGGGSFSSGTRVYQRPNVFFKYPYLQKQHNRSPLDYKSPYSQSGGFMNGYEGDLKEHLKQNPEALFSRGSANMSSSSPLIPNPLHYGQKQSYVPPPVTYSSRPSHSPSVSKSYNVTPSLANQSSNSPQQKPLLPQQTSKTISNVWEKREPSQFHPAIRPNYSSNMFHQQYQPPIRTDQTGRLSQVQATAQLTQTYSGHQPQSTMAIMSPQLQQKAQQTPIPGSQVAERQRQQSPQLQLSVHMNSQAQHRNAEPLECTPVAMVQSHLTQLRNTRLHIPPSQLPQHIPAQSLVSQPVTAPPQSSPSVAAPLAVSQHAASPLVISQPSPTLLAVSQPGVTPPALFQATSGPLAVPQPAATTLPEFQTGATFAQLAPQLAHSTQTQKAYAQHYHPMNYQNNAPVYAHQQYFQKPPVQPQQPPQEPREVPDVPVDSTSLVEQMMANLRRASASS